MIVKLTYYENDRITLVNLDHIITAYYVYDGSRHKISTKLCMVGGMFINVKETLQEILKIQEDMINKENVDMNLDIPTIDEMVELAYKPKKRILPKQDFHY